VQAGSHGVIRSTVAPTPGGNSDGWISAEECYAYLAPRVVEFTTSEVDPQHPQLFDGCSEELEFLR